MKLRMILAVPVAVVLSCGLGLAQSNGRALQNRYTLGPVFGDVIGNCADVGVGDFLILNDWTASVHDMMLLDQDGQPKQLIENFKIDWDVYRNSVTGKSTSGAHGENQELRWLFENGQIVFGEYSGPVYRVSVPGLGTIFSETGRAKFQWDPLTGAHWVVFNSGHNDYLDKDLTALCNYLK